MSGTTDMRYAKYGTRTEDIRYAKYGNRTEEEWKAVQEERRPEVYELLNRLGYTHKADIANLKIYQSANGFKIQDGITDQVYESIRKDAALGGVLTNYGESTPSATNTEQPNIYDSLYSNAEAYKNSAYGYANSTHQSSYALAEKARQEAEAQAEIERKRGIVDADTLYQQQKATYGANAEQLGRMGLNVSGYSDYLNSQAYASGMAYRQAANAQAAETKRQATYQEAISKLEADKVRDAALAEADKTYYSTMSEIELQKKADADAKETAQQTNYRDFVKFAVENNLTSEQIESIGSTIYGITDQTKLNDVKTAVSSYAEVTGVNTSELEISLAAHEASKDFINAAVDYVNINYPNATDEQKKTFQASYIVDHIDDIDDSNLTEYANKINNGDYGTAGGEAIKKAVSQIYIDSADSLSKERLKTVIDSGILTTEAQSLLDTIYANKYGETKQEQVSIATENATEIFGKFAGSNNSKSDQSIYIRAIEDMVSNGDISEGEYVAVNYGDAINQVFYKYLGDKKFEKASAFDAIKGTIRTPTGYKFDKGRQVVGKTK